jgi:Raf kinase inhibitor-like YbhB/YbcL family protein
MRDVLDLDRYPLDRPESPAFEALVASCQRAMAANGMFNLARLTRDASMKSLWVSWVAASALLAGPTMVGRAQAPKPQTLVLRSHDIHAGRRFPDPFVSNAAPCTGGNRSPQLQWSGVPAGTKSFVLTMFDRDEHSTPSGWWHWVVYDIPATADHLPENAGTLGSTALPAGTLQGRNDDGDMAYAGPCPDIGDPPHRYVLTLYALKIDRLPVPAGASGANVTSTARDYIIAKSALVARHDEVAKPTDKVVTTH